MKYNGLDFDTTCELTDYLNDEWLNVCDAIAHEEGVADADLDEWIEKRGERYVHDIMKEFCWAVINVNTNEPFCWAFDPIEADIYCDELNDAAGHFLYKVDDPEEIKRLEESYEPDYPLNVYGPHPDDYVFEP